VTDELVIVLVAISVYFLVVNAFILGLLVMSYGETAWLTRGRVPGRSRVAPLSQRPGISIVVPAYNEQEVVVASLSAMLEQQYAPLEIVLVDDGSTDATVERIDAAFGLVPLPLGPPPPPETAPVRAHYAARRAPALRVVSKENGGRADAVNAGLGFARHELILATDADCLLAPDALARLLRAFVEYPDDCVAAGGSIRLLDASRVARHRVVEPEVSGRSISATQVIEYLRGFLGARIAWSRMNGLIIVSGGFGLFRRETLIAAGGFRADAIGEDMEATTRLHHVLRPRWPQARVSFIPDAVCWTQGPSTLRGLRSQRVRWQVGLLETIALHRGMLWRRRYGAAGMLALPYAAVVEALAPLLQLLGYSLVVVVLIIDLSTWPWAAALVAATVLVGLLESIVALQIEELGFRYYGRRDLTRLLGWSLLEAIIFRPLVALMQAEGTVRVLIGRKPGWGTIPRRALEQKPAEEIAPIAR
jgi:cellulose synthase/poly-beta-1,6-N-acetylglucosamine synthase-like glycosyltransferase